MLQVVPGKGKDWTFGGKTFVERMLAKVDRRGPDECWEWLGGKGRRGYGRIRRRGHSYAVHREMFRVYRPKEYSRNLHVLHRCDNPSCVNPAHLYAGTHDDNMEDRQSKNRHVHGERVNTAKLTRQDVEAILSLWGKGDISQTELARHYSVSRRAIGKIVDGDSWKHVPREFNGKT